MNTFSSDILNKLRNLEHHLKSNIKGQGRRRAHSRVSDSGWLTDEIIGGQVDDFDFEGNLGKFDKRRDWEEFRVPLPNQGELTLIENG